jgi:tRNA (adenine22-N1)-methyltransferase
MPSLRSHLYALLGVFMEQKQLKLQPRLQKIADLVPSGAHLADVGTDHGYLPVWLLQNKKINSAIASDIRPMPLAHARKTAAAFGGDTIEFRLCDGLNGIAADEVDTIVIAGMGGEMIADILTAAPWTLTSNCTLLLQPMSKPEFLRRWLPENGYCFRKECLVWDKDVLYPIFQVSGGTCPPLTAAEQYGGVLLSEDPLYSDYLDRQILRLERAASGLRMSETGEDHRRAGELDLVRQALLQRKESL